jgi:hypothetical protein
MAAWLVQAARATHHDYTGLQRSTFQESNEVEEKSGKSILNTLRFPLQDTWTGVL